MTEFHSTVDRWSVWTSDSEGDLFEANIIKIDGLNVYFYMNTKLVKQYVATDFIRWNPKMLESIKEKQI